MSASGERSRPGATRRLVSALSSSAVAMQVRRGPLVHLHRFWVIASPLLRHGLGWAVGPSGVGRPVPFHHGWLGHPERDEPYERHEHIRMLLEDLGPTFMKIGRILSSRADLLPPAYRA